MSSAGLPGLELAPHDAEALPDAHDMARLGALRLAAGAGLDPAELKPRYVRDKVAFTEAERLASQIAPVMELSQTDAVITR